MPTKAALIVKLAVAGRRFVIGWLAVNVLGGIVLVRVPDIVNAACTGMEITQVPTGVGGVALAGMVPPETLINVSPTK